MGSTHARRLRNQIISRRRTQFTSKKTKADNDIGTSGDTGDNKTSEETSTGQDVGGNTSERLDKAD